MKPLSKIIVTTGDGISGHEIIQYVGIVRGISLRTNGISEVMPQRMGIFKLGGILQEVLTMCDASREKALEKMLIEAQRIGANAVIGFRYDTSPLNKRIHEILAYGTAVKIKRCDLSLKQLSQYRHVTKSPLLSGLIGSKSALKA